MELAQTQLARAVPSLLRNAGTSNQSIHSDRLALAFMSEWHSFQTDALRCFREARITHEVPIHDETEVYTVGNEIGVSGRFIRNICDPVMKALKPLHVMNEIRFADYQAISIPDDNIPDVCLGVVSVNPTPDNVSLVGEFKTPWTSPDAFLHLNRPNTSYHLEPLIGETQSILTYFHLLTLERFFFLFSFRTACCPNAYMLTSLWILVDLQLNGFC